MRILNISQLLPIPGFYRENNFVFEVMEYYKLLFPSDSIFFFRPVPYTNKILRKYFQKSSTSLPENFKEYKYKKHNVRIIKYFSAWSINNLHAILSNSIYFMNRRYIRNLILEKKISVVHAQYIFPDGLLALILKKKFNIPYIITTHSELKYFDNYISRKLALSILRNAYKVIPLNYRNYNFFSSQRLFNLEVIPLGFDKSFISCMHKNNSDHFSIISVCELLKLKNIDKVLIALSILKRKYNIRYTVIGEGPEIGFLKNLANKLAINDIVDFLGYYENLKIPQVLSSNDLFVLPSYPETFGRVYFEAFAAGLPVICAKNSGIYGYFPELVDIHAVNPNDPEEIAERITFFIERQETRCNTGKTLQKLVSEFTWDKIAYKYGKLYREAKESI